MNNDNFCLFFQPMSLNCGHVFCEFCINQWKDKCSKNTAFTCPNCRQPITSQTRSLHLENLISSLYQDVDESIKDEREKLVKYRKEEIAKAAQEKAKGTGKGKKPNPGHLRHWVANPAPNVSNPAGRAQTGPGPSNQSG